MNKEQFNQLIQELTEIKQRLSVLESKFNIQTDVLSTPVCLHELEDTMGGKQCKKCGTVVSFIGTHL